MLVAETQTTPIPISTYRLFNGYILIPDWLIKHRHELPAGYPEFYAMVQRIIGQNGTAQIYNETLANRLDVSVRTVERYNEFSRAQRLIDITPTGRAGLFTLLWHPWMGIDEETARKREVELSKPKARSPRAKAAQAAQAAPTDLAEQIRQDCRIAEPLSLLDQEKHVEEKLAGTTPDEVAILETDLFACSQTPVNGTEMVQEERADSSQDDSIIDAQAIVISASNNSITNDDNASSTPSAVADDDSAQSTPSINSQPSATPNSPKVARAVTKVTRKIVRASQRVASGPQPSSELQPEPDGERKTRHSWQAVLGYALAEAKKGSIDNVEAFAGWLWREGKQDAQIERWRKAHADLLVGSRPAQPMATTQPATAAPAQPFSNELLRQLQNEREQYQRLEELAQTEFNKLSPDNQEQLIRAEIDKMLVSEHRDKYRRMPKEGLIDAATYRVKKGLILKLTAS